MSNTSPSARDILTAAIIGGAEGVRGPDHGWLGCSDANRRPSGHTSTGYIASTKSDAGIATRRTAITVQIAMEKTCTCLAVQELTVINGSGSGMYEAEERVQIETSAGVGFRYGFWSISRNEVWPEVDNFFSRKTSIVMPAANVTVEFVTISDEDKSSSDDAVKTYGLTVINGSGSGMYEAGERVQIETSVGVDFKNGFWSISKNEAWPEIENIFRQKTSLVMPAGGITIQFVKQTENKS